MTQIYDRAQRLLFKARQDGRTPRFWRLSESDLRDVLREAGAVHADLRTYFGLPIELGWPTESQMVADPADGDPPAAAWIYPL